MPIAYPAILDEHSSGRVRNWNARDAILYALGIGLPADPLDSGQLAFVDETRLSVVPTFAAILARGLGVPATRFGFDLRALVHGEQAIVWHRPIGPSGTVTGEGCVVAAYDKGDRGAVVITDTDLHDSADGLPIATVRVTYFARADGHFGGPVQSAAPHPMPDRRPDRTLLFPTRPDLALLYRLNGDLNPIHIDPQAARRAGFDRPILHGQCTFGIACRAILQAYCALEPARLASQAARFSAPAYPGDTLAIDLWRDGAILSFEARVPERGVTVLRNGRATLMP